MGAAQFTTIAVGKDAKEAFASATSDARYMSGHGGYTGTIAEKSDFCLFTLRDDIGVRVSQIANWALDYRGSDDSMRPEVPAALRGTVAAIGRGVMDKWGPAGCIEVKGQAADYYRKDHNLSADTRVFYFFGWASE